MAHITVGGGEGGVSELLLDDRYGYTFGHEFICVGVTEPVRVDTLLNVSLVGEARQEGPYIGGFQWLALEGAEQGMYPLNPNVCLASSQRLRMAIAPGSRPTTRRRSPLPWTAM